MPSSYTPSLKLTLPATGELTGTWGDTVNTGITSLLDAAVAGTANVVMTDADYTLTTVDGAADEARRMFVVLTGTISASRNIICPSASKLYFVKNSTTGGFAVTFKTSAGTGISIPSGASIALYCDGTNVLDAITFANIPVINATTVDTTNLEVTNIKAKDGTASIALADSTGVATIAAAPVLTALTASKAVFTNSSKALVSNEITGTGNVVMSMSPTLTTPILGTPQSVTLTNATGLPISTGVSGLGTGVAGALANNLGTAGAPIVFDGALGTPSSGTVTNLTGTASININGTVGATTANTGSFTTLTTSGAVTHNAGTANGVTYLNNSKVLTSGSALTFDGTKLLVGNAQVSGSEGLFVSGNITGSAPFINGGNLELGATTSSALIQAYNRPSFGAYNLDLKTTTAFTFSLSGSEQMRLTSTGLGIGTSSPAYPVDSGGAINSRLQGSSSTLAYKINGDGSWAQPNLIGHWYSVGSGKDLTRINVPSSIANSAFLDFDSSGNLGLGVTPSAWFSSFKGFDLSTAGAISGSGNGTILWANGFINASASEQYKTTGFAVKYVAASDIGAHIWLTAPSGTAGTAITFTQAMTLDASGNFYIGTTSQSGGSNITFNQPANADMKIAAAVSTGTRAAYQVFVNNTVTSIGTENSTGGSLASGTSAYSTVLANSGAYPISFATNNTERARIDSSGNLGLGVTPSAWVSQAKVLEQPAGSLYSYETIDLELLQNNYYNGANFIYKNIGTATRYQMYQGAHAWYTAPSGTAGNAISFTQAMTLDASGNLLVGTTSLTVAQNGFQFIGGASTSSAYINHPNGATSGAIYAAFNYNATQIGSITQNGTTAVAYNTSSDYRLKKITGPITTSGAYIDSLNPVEGTWKSDGSAFVGLLAHEVQEASRTTVATGTKDGEEMQAMDYSSAEIIANLIAEVKSLRQRLAAAGI